MRKAMLKLIRSEGGFTLTELLATIVVVTLATTMVANGIPSAMEAYGKMMDSSNAQTLLSTTITMLRDELAMSTDIEVSGTAVTYVSDESGRVNMISIAPNGDTAHEGELLIALNYDPDEEQVTFTPLAPLGASSGKGTGELYVTCTGISMDTTNEVITFEGLEVCKEDSTGSEKSFASIDAYEVRLISNYS